MKVETKERIRRGAWAAARWTWGAFKEVAAPVVVAGGIATGLHLEGAAWTLFGVCFLTLYWSYVWKLEAKSRVEAKFRVHLTFLVPEGVDPEDVAEMIRLNTARKLKVSEIIDVEE